MFLSRRNFRFGERRAQSAKKTALQCVLQVRYEYHAKQRGPLTSHRPPHDSGDSNHRIIRSAPDTENPTRSFSLLKLLLQDNTITVRSATSIPRILQTSCFASSSLSLSCPAGWLHLQWSGAFTRRTTTSRPASRASRIPFKLTHTTPSLFRSRRAT